MRARYAAHADFTTHRCTIVTRADALACPVRIAALAREAGFSAREVTELQIVTSEICTNIVHHGERGTLQSWVTPHPNPGMVIVAEDEGPGFHDLELARVDGVSGGRLLADAPDARVGGGLGTGIGTLERLADQVEITNLEGGGARVSIFKAMGPASSTGGLLPR